MSTRKAAMNIAYPYQFDAGGRTAQALDEAHVRDLIEQVLFTSPGERVMRPDFGCGVAQLVFAPNSVELAGATQVLVQSALQAWLPDLVTVLGVSVEADDASLVVKVAYRLSGTDQPVLQTFTQAIGGGA